MRSRFCAALALFALLIPWAAQAQLLDDGKPTGIWVVPAGTFKKGGTGHIHACAGAPGRMMLVASEYGSIRAIGPGFFLDRPLSEPVASRPDFNAASGLSLGEIGGLAASWNLDRLFVGFRKYGVDTTPGSPLFEVTLDGEISVVVPMGEFLPFFTDNASINALAPGPDGILWAAAGNATDRALLRIDLDGAPGSRVTPVLTSAQLKEKLPLPDGTQLEEIYEWGIQLAADDTGRVFFRAQPVIANAETAGVTSMVILRLDPDGTVTALTDFEYSPVGETTASYYMDFPAFGTWNGLSWDPERKLLVGVGNGLWLINPDKPHDNYPFQTPEQVTDVAYMAAGEGYHNNPSGAIQPGSCLARLEDGWFGTMMYAYMQFKTDWSLLDYDQDGLAAWEEELLGTDPMVEDSDGGGIIDGRELIDLTDPTDGADDRDFPAPPDELGSSGIYWNSAFASGLSGGNYLSMYALPAGKELLVQMTTGSNASNLFRFRDWDTPAEMTEQPGLPYYMARDLQGNIYGMDYDDGPNVHKGPVRITPNGSKTTLFKLEEVQKLVGPDPVPSSWTVEASGRVWVGYRSGQLLRSTSDGGVELFYDARAEHMKVGWLDENGMIPDVPCSMSVIINELTYEPVRGIVYFALNREISCPGGTGTMPVIAAGLPDDTIAHVGNSVNFRHAVSMYGAADIVDIEPDMAGGFYLLATHLLNRSLTHFDANWHSREMHLLETPNALGGSPSNVFAHGVDLVVTTDQRLFISTGCWYNQYPTTFGLVELVPQSRAIRAGEILLVHPDMVTLSKLSPAGGGINLLSGEPLGQPTAVAATEEEVVVADRDLGALLRFPVDDDGNLGEPMTIGGFAAMGGIDLEADGSVVACDVAGNRVVRFAPDGTESVVAQGTPLSVPTDVVATASGTLFVASEGNDRVVRIGPDGTMESVVDFPSPHALAVLPDKGLVVASLSTEAPPVRIDRFGQAEEILREPARAMGKDHHVPGGLAAQADGTVYWFHSTDTQPGTPIAGKKSGYVLRINRDGWTGSMTKPGIASTEVSGDLCIVRGRNEGPPAMPAIVLSEGGDVTAEPDGGTTGEPCGGKSGGGGCTTGASATGSALGLLVGLLGLLAAARRQRGRTLLVAGSLLALGLAACGGEGGGATDCKPQSEFDVPGSWDGWGDFDMGMWVPEEVVEKCKGKALCKAGAGPECVDDETTRRCMMDVDGCWVWESAPCMPGGSCLDGSCELCLPFCSPIQECGDDGCGGSCGECTIEGEVCCDHFYCGPCTWDCTEKVCGHDGVGGYCGDCPGDDVCAHGQCHPKGKGICGDWFSCWPTCEMWDDPCWEDCEAWLDDWSKGKATELSACLTVHCNDCPPGPDEEACFDKCLFTECALPFAECFAENGTLTCKEIYQCLEPCADGDQACYDGCYFAGSPYHLLYAIQWEQCVDEVCVGLAGDAFEACVQEAAFGDCATPFKTCLGDCDNSCEGQECGVNDCMLSCGKCAAGQECVEGTCQ